jgi:hypothetical protein
MEIGKEDWSVDYINVAQCRDWWYALVNKLMNIQVP